MRSERIGPRLQQLSFRPRLPSPHQWYLPVGALGLLLVLLTATAWPSSLTPNGDANVAAGGADSVEGGGVGSLAELVDAFDVEPDDPLHPAAAARDPAGVTVAWVKDAGTFGVQARGSTGAGGERAPPTL